MVNVHGRACEIWDADAKFGDVSEGAAGLVHAFIFFFVNYEHLLHPRRAVFSPSEYYDGAVSRKSHLSPNTNNIFIDTRALEIRINDPLLHLIWGEYKRKHLDF